MRIWFGEPDQAALTGMTPAGMRRLVLPLEYQVVHNLALTSTLMVNLHDISLAPLLPDKDRTNVTLLFGFSP